MLSVSNRCRSSAGIPVSIPSYRCSGGTTRAKITLPASPFLVIAATWGSTHSASFEPSNGTKIFLYVFSSFSLFIVCFAHCIRRLVILSRFIASWFPLVDEGFNYGFVKSGQVSGFTRGDKVPIPDHRLIDPDCTGILEVYGY